LSYFIVQNFLKYNFVLWGVGSGEWGKKNSSSIELQASGAVRGSGEWGKKILYSHSPATLGSELPTSCRAENEAVKYGE
jgi:hypothetical protein